MCVQPNSPIIILILLTVFHKFAMSLGAKHRWSCTERFSFLLGEFHLPFDGNKPWHCRGWTHRPGNGLSFKKNPKSFFLASVNWSTLSWVENLAWSLCQSPQMGPSQGRELSYMKSHHGGIFDKESALKQPLNRQQIFCMMPRHQQGHHLHLLLADLFQLEVVEHSIAFSQIITQLFPLQYLI